MDSRIRLRIIVGGSIGNLLEWYDFAIYGYLAFHDTPASTRALWLTPEEKELAVNRLPIPEKSRGHIPFTLFTSHIHPFRWFDAGRKIRKPADDRIHVQIFPVKLTRNAPQAGRAQAFEIAA